MSPDAKLFSGIILITIPTIQYGGLFLLKILSGQDGLALTDFQKSMFRAGHAHAGVLVMLAIIAQILIDNTTASRSVEMFLRVGFAVAPILISGGFFASASGKNRVRPNSLIKILYTGVSILAVVLIFLGVELIKSR